MEASTGIEPVYTDLQSAASPLRQLAAVVVEQAISGIFRPLQVELRHAWEEIYVSVSDRRRGGWFAVRVFLTGGR